MASHGPPPEDLVEAGIYQPGNLPAPDPQVTAAENAMVQATRGRMFETTVTEKQKDGDRVDVTESMPGRSSYGTKGRSITLRTNYLKLNTAYDGVDPSIPEVTLHKYNVSILHAESKKDKNDKEPGLSKPRMRRLVKAILENDKFKNKLVVTDYAQIIVTTEPIDLGPDGRWADSLVLPPENPVQDRPESETRKSLPDIVDQGRKRNTVKFGVQFDGSYSPRHMLDYLRSTSTGADYSGRNNLIQLLNIVMVRRPQDHVEVVKVGQNKFYAFGGHPACQYQTLGGNIQALRGYFASVRPAIGRLLLNLNVTSGAFYQSMPLLQLGIEGADARQLSRHEAFLRMVKVDAFYKKDNPTPEKPNFTKIKTIVGFAPGATKKNPLHGPRFGDATQIKFRFEDRSVQPPNTQIVSVYDYFRTHHGITLKFPRVPVLNVGTKTDPQWLPLELCTIRPGQPYRRMLDGEQTTAMLGFAARPPNANALSITGTAAKRGKGLGLFSLAVDGVNNVQTRAGKPFGVTVGTEMITVPGRILSAPRIKYGKQEIQTKFGSWNCANQRFVTTGAFAKWQVLVINHGNKSALRSDRDTLVNNFAGALRGYGIEMGTREPTQEVKVTYLANIANREDNDKVLRGAFNKASEKGVRMLFIILPAVETWLYSRIKFHLDTKLGIHSICAVGSKFERDKNQGMFFGNLALKFNIKGGGVCHAVSGVLAQKPLERDENSTMLVGIDVTHPSPGSTEGAPSIAGIVASVDKHLYQWPGSIRSQTGRKEMVSALKEMVVERLECWQKFNNRQLPKKIVIYRDGVSEGQYPLVLRHELSAFHQAFEQVYKGQEWPKVAIIVVGKRHHTRFYPTNAADADQRSANPLPGTVVDRGIAGKILHEFWLQAHQGLQGTARPAHYVVIKDDIGFGADALEQLTHHLCYMFNRAPKAVSICPPAYYADLLCERGRAYLYSTLQENVGSDDGSYNPANAEWTDGVHANLKDSTWYI